MFFPVVAPLEASKACAGLANAPEIAGSAGNLTSAEGHGVGTRIPSAPRSKGRKLAVRSIASTTVQIGYHRLILSRF